jgi:hypothetical protein
LNRSAAISRQISWRYTRVSIRVLFQIRRQKLPSRRTAGVSFPVRANTFPVSTTSKSNLEPIQLPVNTGTGKLADMSTRLQTYIQGRSEECVRPHLQKHIVFGEWSFKNIRVHNSRAALHNTCRTKTYYKRGIRPQRCTRLTGIVKRICLHAPHLIVTLWNCCRGKANPQVADCDDSLQI